MALEIEAQLHSDVAALLPVELALGGETVVCDQPNGNVMVVGTGGESEAQLGGTADSPTGSGTRFGKDSSHWANVATQEEPRFSSIVDPKGARRPGKIQLVYQYVAGANGEAP